MINPALDTSITSELACLFAQVPVDTLFVVAVCKLDEIQNMEVSKTSFSDARAAFKFWTLFNNSYKWYSGKSPNNQIWADVCESVLKIRSHYFENNYLPPVCDAYNKANIDTYNFHLLENGDPVNFVERMVAGTKHLRLEQTSFLHRKHDSSALKAELYLHDFKNVASVRKKFTDCGITRSIYVHENTPFKVNFVVDLPNGASVERGGNCKLGVDYEFKKLDMDMNGGSEDVRVEIWHKLGGL